MRADTTPRTYVLALLCAFPDSKKYTACLDFKSVLDYTVLGPSVAVVMSYS